MRSVGRAFRATAYQLNNGFRSVQCAPWQLWLVYSLKFLESYNYFSLAVSFTVYLSDNFGISDLEAGSIYGLWGTLLTAYGFILGPIIDSIGIRGSLITCFAIGMFSRYVVAVTTSKAVLYSVLLGPLSVSGSLGVPVLTIAVKRFTSHDNRGFAYALFYTVMNIASLLNGVLFDVFRQTLRHGLKLVGVGDQTIWNNGYRMFIVSGCITSFLGFVLSFFITQPGDSADKVTPHSAESGTSGTRVPSSSVATPLLHDASEGEQKVSQDSPKPLSLRKILARSTSVLDEVDVRELLKYMAMCVISVNLKAIFRHLEATLPKYRIRSFGRNTSVGLIYSINPFMILLLVPVVGALTAGFQHFDMIHYGGYISAVSPLFIVAFNTAWASIPFVIMLSVGEAIWSPRWYDYSMAVAPEGREGLFTAAGSAPLFLATLPTGMISGKLLEVYCPGSHISQRHPKSQEDVGCNGRALWSIISAITLSSPIMITLTQRWLRPKPNVSEQLSAMVVLDEDDPANLTHPITEQDERQVFGEIEAERHEGGIIGAAHRPNAVAHAQQQVSSKSN